MKKRSSLGPLVRGPRAFRVSAPLYLALVAIVAGACSSSEPPGRSSLQRVSQVGGSPYAGCVSDEPARRLANESGEVEPTLAVDPGDPDRIAIAWQQDRWFDGASRGIVVATSSDRGLTWTRSAETKLSVCSGGTPANGGDYPRVTDPWLSFSSDGTLHLSGLSVNLDARASAGADPEAVLATRSGDGGLTWTDPVALVRDEDPRVYNDKPSVTADPHDDGLVYAVWHRLSDRGSSSVDGDTRFAGSRDGGDTWGPPRTILGPLRNGQSFGNEIVVLPSDGGFRGQLINVFSLISWRKGGEPEKMRVAAIISEDRGRTWSKPIIVADMKSVPVEDPSTDLELKTGRLLPRVAVDPDSGTIYVAWSESSFGAGDHNDVALSMSADAGASWTDPVRVNRTPALEDVANRQTFTPEVSATAEEGVAIAYYDSRNNRPDQQRGAPLETDLFLVRCLDPSPTEADLCAGEWVESRVTETSFDMRAAPDSGGPFLGDYIGLAAAGTHLIAAFPQAGDATDPASIYLWGLPPLATADP